MKTGLNEFFLKDGQLYYVYVPPSFFEDPQKGKTLIAVHGYSGRKDNQSGRKRVQRAAERWSHLADRNRWVVIAPHFDEKRFKNNYQRLNFDGVRADTRLDEIVFETANRLRGIRTEKLMLFGFSGGGQFVHRYAAFHPNRIERAVAAAAGWYLWPDATLPYPIGTEAVRLQKLPKPQIRKLCRLNLLIIVGEYDADQGTFRKTFKRHNLSVLQGEGRRIRAQNWIEALKKHSGIEEKDFKITFKIAPNTGHAISKRLRRMAGEFLSE